MDHSQLLQKSSLWEYAALGYWGIWLIPVTAESQALVSSSAGKSMIFFSQRTFTAHTPLPSNPEIGEKGQLDRIKTCSYQVAPFAEYFTEKSAMNRD